MAEKKEMSLDEVLSSIKKMVVDTEPPVLDLTDMVAEDGSIVKVGENGETTAEEGMGTFLQLAHDDADNERQEEEKHQKAEQDEQPKKAPEKAVSEKKLEEDCQISEKIGAVPNKNDVMVEIFREISAPEVKKRLDAKLPGIISEAVRPAIDQWLDKNVRRWLDENLPKLAGSAIEREIRSLLNNKEK